MKKAFFLSLFLTAISAALALWVIFTHDGQIPTNWNAAGEIDAYGSPLTLLIFPVTSFLTTLLLVAIPRIDPRGDNIKKSGPVLPIVTVLVSALMLGILAFIIAAIHGADIIHLPSFTLLFIGLMFIILGRYMPRVKPNYMLGIRTPWTLASDKVWIKTHQESGKWFILSGVIFLFSIFLSSPLDFIIPFSFMALVMIGIVVYSYLLFTREKPTKPKKRNK
ncbi:SdpI family protein [Candidatus Saccharibacteria bacterium]|nr:SdpI family protein [Candidatus Saccharibacteria bacterium]